MESRKEIELMRVIDLREFLRRHGHSVNRIARDNGGTPGPMRKAELLEAALKIHDHYTEGKPSPSRPSSAANVVPNPFQTGLPTPPDNRRATPSPPLDDHPPPPIDDRPSPEPPAQEQPPPPKTPPPKPRRRSAAWVDPVLLAQMRATTPTKPNDSSFQARPIAPRPFSTPPKKLPSRVITDPSPIRPPKRLPRQASPERRAIRPAQRASARTPIRNDTSRGRMSLTPRRLPVQRTQDRPSYPTNGKQVVDVHQVVDVPPPPPPQTTSSALWGPIEPRRLALEIDYNYVSDEDPDYDADAEEADPDDPDYPVFDEEMDNLADSAQAGPAPKYMDMKFSPPIPKGQDVIDLDGDMQEDILIDSDHYRSESAGDSDPGSTIDTENEDQVRNFSDWSTADIKAWLRDHNVNFLPGANRDVLISMARAHALHMEATASIQRRDLEHQNLAGGEDEIVPNRHTEGSVRRHRVISAPPPDDESDVMEIRPASPPTSRRPSKTVKREFVYNPKPARVESKRRRPVFVLLPLIALFIFLCSSGYVAMSVLRKHLSMTFCDTGATSTLLDNEMECRPCPRNGRCVNGSLQCDPGFVELRGRCLEDKEFNLFSERLAYSAFELLSELAGRAECGEEVPRAVSPDELVTAMHSLYSRRRQSFNAQKFEDAMAKAILTLQTDDAFDVSVADNGYFSSNVPKFSAMCRLQRKMWEYKRAFLGAIGILFLIAYVRVRRYFHDVHERRLDEAHASALEYLRDQVNAFRNNEEDVAFVPDVVLREEVVGRPTAENKKFWKEVEDRLNRDARVIRKHQVLKGMPSYTFEYVGSRRGSGRRNSGTFFESLSRRSSFGSRTSLDSLDMGQEGNSNGTQRRTFLDRVVRLFSQKTD